MYCETKLSSTTWVCERFGTFFQASNHKFSNGRGGRGGSNVAAAIAVISSSSCCCRSFFLLLPLLLLLFLSMLSMPRWVLVAQLDDESLRLAKTLDRLGCRPNEMMTVIFSEQYRFAADDDDDDVARLPTTVAALARIICRSYLICLWLRLTYCWSCT